MNRRRVFCALTALWLLVIWGHSLLPADMSRAESGRLFALLQSWLPWLTHHLLRKIAHFTEYAVLGALLCLARGGRERLGAAFPAAFGVLAAMVDETIQLFVPGRSGEITDVWLDLAGFLVGYGLARVITRKREQ